MQACACDPPVVRRELEVAIAWPVGQHGTRAEVDLGPHLPSRDLRESHRDGNDGVRAAVSLFRSRDHS